MADPADLRPDLTSDPSRPGVMVVGMVPPGASGVRDYGGLLAEELNRRGFDVSEAWVVSHGRSLHDAVACSLRFLRVAISVPAGVAVVWNYSSFAYGLRGIPMPGVLLGAVLRLRGRRVVTVLHELAYPWGRRGWRGNLQALTQWMAFEPVRLGSEVLVVTTEQRATALRRRRWHFSRPVHSAPVFSTIGAPAQVRRRVPPQADHVVGILNYTGDGARPDVVIGALERLLEKRRLRLLILGAPGPMHPAAQPWRILADDAGVGDHLDFTGVLSRADLIERLESCTAVVLPNDHGPSGRRTTLAAALAHGVPTVAIDGPERWEELAGSGAVIVVPADEDAVAVALDNLLDSPERQRELSRRGRAFYDGHMAVERLGALMTTLLRPELPA